MRVVIGIDPSHDSTSTTNLVHRLAFHEAEATYASFATFPAVPAPGFAITADELIEQLIDERRGAAKAAMCSAADSLRGRVVGEEMVFEFGEPASELASLAEDMGADLIAIGSRGESPLKAAMHGSVGRGLVLHSKRSILIAKGEVSVKGPIKAVFAYDASDCCERSIDQLIEMRPLGISHIDLVIADTPDPSSSPITALLGEDAWHAEPEKRADILWTYACSAAERLTRAGYVTRPICASGAIPVVIEGAYVDLHADLVIMGAKGHGFVHRVLFGSNALEQAVAENHSVLILHPGEAKLSHALGVSHGAAKFSV